MRVIGGTLYIVATPIGNLGDITYRAVEVLGKVDRIYAEDTRRTRALLNHYAVHTEVVSFHEHNESARIASVLKWLQQGMSAALVSDAGTPLINDPGYRLVEKCHAFGIKVSPVPGASAAIAALSVSGLPTDRFFYLGFPPAKREMRKKWLSSIAQFEHTLVLYESRHRITACLSDISEIMGDDREVTLARELTKQFETVVCGTVCQVIGYLNGDHNQQKGEFVLVINGAAAENLDDAKVKQVLTMLLEDLPVKRSAEIASVILGEKKNRLYQLALQLNQ